MREKIYVVSNNHDSKRFIQKASNGIIAIQKAFGNSHYHDSYQCNPAKKAQYAKYIQVDNSTLQSKQSGIVYHSELQVY